MKEERPASDVVGFVLTHGSSVYFVHRARHYAETNDIRC